MAKISVFGTVAAAGEDLGEEPVAERLQHGADLVGGGHRAVELRCAVLQVLVERLELLHPGAPVDLRHDGAGLDGRALLADLGADPVDVEVDVDAVGDRLGVGVLGDQVLPEEAERLLARGGGQADDVGVEVLQHSAPHAVDAAVRLVDDHQVEGLGRQHVAVGDGDRRVRDEVVEARVVGVGDLAFLQELVDPLDRGDHDLGRAEQSRAGELGDVVELGEPAPVVGGAVVLELRERLVGEVVAVDQEQDPVEPAVLEQPVGLGDRRVGLAGAGGHLHQRPVVPLLGEARSIPPMASIWAGRRGAVSRSGRWPTLARHVGRSGFASASRRMRASVSGIGKLKISRARGSGSKPLVKWVSVPLASKTNGSRPSLVSAASRTSAGRPSAYIADCHSTPDRVVPTGLASMTPTTALSTYSR